MERVPAPVTFDLRRRVLRPHQEIGEIALPGDDDPDTAFFAVRDATSGEILSTASVRHEAPPWDLRARRNPDHPGPGCGPEVPRVARSAAGSEGADAWRLRAMATEERVRGQGLGRRVLEAVIDHVAATGGGLLWCSARIGAVSFYERAGFTTSGEPYQEPVIGTHVLMWRTVAVRAR